MTKIGRLNPTVSVQDYPYMVVEVYDFMSSRVRMGRILKELNLWLATHYG